MGKYKIDYASHWYMNNIDINSFNDVCTTSYGSMAMRLYTYAAYVIEKLTSELKAMPYIVNGCLKPSANLESRTHS